MMSLLEDEETQKNGIVDINYMCTGPDGGNPPPPDPEFLSRASPLMSSLPYRPRGLHFCTDSKMMGLFHRALAPLMEKQLRVRLRVHVGAFKRIKRRSPSFVC